MAVENHDATTAGSVPRRWRLRESEAGLRMVPLRALGSATFTWADLLRSRLRDTQVYVLYMPSRFDLDGDRTVRDALHAFGKATSTRTSVNLWDPTDVHFSDAVRLFGLAAPPALVLVGGLQPGTAPSTDPGTYTISFTDTAVLGDRAVLGRAVNLAHEVLMRCDPDEIGSYIRRRRIRELLRVVGAGAGAVRDEIVKLKPSFGLPGGVTVGLG